MKVQCPVCREIVEMSQFETSPAGLRFSCSGCGKETFLPNPKATSAEVAGPTPTSTVARAMPATDTGETSCPKCGNAQRDSRACHRCGLIFAKWDPTQAPTEPAALVEAWAGVEQRPEEDAVHEAFAQACLQAGRLDVGARRYRLWQRLPGRQTKAEAMLERLVELGQARLGGLPTMPSAQPATDSKKKLVYWIIIILCMLGTFWMITRMGGGLMGWGG